jgi:membrane protein YqaA with SNARE-associated domain
LAGSVLGGLAGYGIGFGAMETVGAWIISTLQLESSVEAFKSKYNQWGDWIVFIAGFSPIPYKVVTILSGAMRMDISSFVFFSILGRGARFYVVSVLLYFFGNPIRKFIEKYFNLLTIIFVLLLVGGFLVVKFVKL